MQVFSTDISPVLGAVLTMQVMLRKSVYLGINTYATVGILAAIMTLFLPIETKGREMKASLQIDVYFI